MGDHLDHLDHRPQCRNARSGNEPDRHRGPWRHAWRYRSDRHRDLRQIALRIYVFRLSFFKRPWSLFYFFVVAVALVPATGALSVLRVLRLVSAVPSLQRVIGGLIAALPGLGSIVLLMSLAFYIFSVMATNLYGETFPEWFGSLGASAYMLFQIMTLESWSMGIVRPVMEAHPWA